MMRNLLSITALALTLVVFGGAYTLGADPAASVQQLIEAAKARPFTPVTAEQLNGARVQAISAVTKLDQVMAGWEPKNRENWKTYLLWEDLHKQLGAPVPTIEELLNPDQNVADTRVRPGSLVRQLTDVWDRFRRDETGLEAPYFIATRDALRNYLDLLSAFEDLRLVMRKVEAGPAPPTPEQLYQQKLSELATAFAAFEQNKNIDTALAVRKPLFWLARQRQAPEVITAVGRHFNQVNGEGQMSSLFMAKSVDQPVHQVSPINDNILGTEVHGTGVMNGISYMRPTSHNPNAKMNLSLTGSVSSKTTGYNGPVTIYSTGLTSVKANKQLLMTPQGLVALPATACCETETNIDCIAAKRRIVEKIAWKRAGKSLPQAEAIASRKAEAKVAAGLDEKANEFIHEANQRYREKMLNPLTRGGIYPQLISYASTPYNLHAYFTRAGSGQLAAFQGRPTADLRYDLTAQFHELLAINMAETRFGGWTLTDLESVRVRNRVAKEKMSIAEQNEFIDDDKRWSITFSEDMPIRVVLDNNHVRVVIRTKRFSIGKSSEADFVRKDNEPAHAMVETDSLYEPMQIQVLYRIVRDADNKAVAYLERVDGGEADENGLQVDIIDPLTDKPAPAGGRATFWKARLKQVLVQRPKRGGEEEPEEEPQDQPAKKRREVFPKYYEFEPIKLEGRMEKLGYLVLDDFQTVGGWGLLAFRQSLTPPAIKKPNAAEVLPGAPPVPPADAN